MVVISYRMIRQYGDRHHESLEALNIWYNIVRRADWSHFHDIRRDFNSVDAIGNDLYVFNIRGNHVRLIVRITFQVRTVYIKFIGNHSEYDQVKPGNL
jgi:mRNA interferase HigB